MYYSILKYDDSNLILGGFDGNIRIVHVESFKKVAKYRLKDKIVIYDIKKCKRNSIAFEYALGTEGGLYFAIIKKNIKNKFEITEMSKDLDNVKNPVESEVYLKGTVIMSLFEYDLDKFIILPSR